MASTRDEALAALGLTATPDADAAAIQRAFERRARRYPQPSFPERFRQLLEARDLLLDPARPWRRQLEERTLDLEWLLPYLEGGAAGTGGAAGAAGGEPDRHEPKTHEANLQDPAARRAHERRTFQQRLLRAGYLAEPIPPSFEDVLARLMDEGPFA